MKEQSQELKDLIWEANKSHKLAIEAANDTVEAVRKVNKQRIITGEKLMEVPEIIIEMLVDETVGDGNE